MPFPDQPVIINIPFADQGSKNAIPDDQVTSGDGTASLSTGFPPETQIPIAAGGIPPRRGDMNGILNLLSQHLCYLGAGAAFYEVANDILSRDGYGLGAVVRPDVESDGRILMSNVNGNKDDFNADPTKIGSSGTWGNILGIPDYMTGVNHYVGDLVIWRGNDNLVYRCIRLNGPDYNGVVQPNDTNHWEQFKGAGGGGGGGGGGNQLYIQTYPVGSIFFHGANTPPDGAFECDGSAKNRTTYVDLFSAIGTTFGDGDGVNTFNVPDLRGYFARGWDHGAGIDAGRVFGSDQDEAVNAESLEMGGSASSVGEYVTSVTVPGPAGGNTGIQNGVNNVRVDSDVVTVDLSGVAIIGSDANQTETRPVNVALLPCIQWRMNDSEIDNFVENTRKITTTVPLRGGGDLSVDRVLTVDNATTAQKGVVELATIAEALAGTDATKAVTPAGLSAAMSQNTVPDKIYINDTTTSGHTPINIPKACNKIFISGSALVDYLGLRSTYTITIAMPGAETYTVVKKGTYSGGAGQPESSTLPIPLFFSFTGPFTAGQIVTLNITSDKTGSVPGAPAVSVAQTIMFVEFVS